MSPARPIALIVSLLVASCSSSDDQMMAAYQEAARLVTASKPVKTLSSGELASSANGRRGDVVQVKGTIDHISFEAGALTLHPDVRCFLQRAEKKRPGLQKGAVVLVRGLLPLTPPSTSENIPGADLFGCMILSIETQVAQPP